MVWTKIWPSSVKLTLSLPEQMAHLHMIENHCVKLLWNPSTNVDVMVQPNSDGRTDRQMQAHTYTELSMWQLWLAHPMGAQQKLGDEGRQCDNSRKKKTKSYEVYVHRKKEIQRDSDTQKDKIQYKKKKSSISHFESILSTNGLEKKLHQDWKII